MRTIKNKSQFVYEINKSKFITFAYPINNESECKEILSSLNKEYNDATHICFAYILFSPQIEKCSDNGEPSGTAGKPILEVLKKRNLNNILCVVIRYFGGKKLGAGGLIRAYTNSANGVLSECEEIDYIKKTKYRVLCDIKYGDKLKKDIINAGGEIIKTNYLEKVEIFFEANEKINLNNYDIEIVE